MKKRIIFGLAILMAIGGIAIANGKCPLHGNYYGETCPTCYGTSAANKYGETMKPSEACKPYNPSPKKVENDKGMSTNTYNNNVSNWNNMQKSKDDCVDAYSQQQLKNQQQQLQNQQQPSNN